jgi:elongator complex protein 1
VFLERNGLRHGEFGLREAGCGEKGRKVEGNGRKWGYKVREMSWSSDSNVLGVWIERDEGDVGEWL